MMLVAGADGCRAGWLCVRCDHTGGDISATLFETARGLLSQRPRPLVLAIDIPIGLPDCGVRACDREARRRLGSPRRSSVFNAPVRAALGASSHPAACQSTRRVNGCGVTIQAFHLGAKIREVDQLLRAEPGSRRGVREVHPELSFWAWNAGVPLRHSKKRPRGHAERRRLTDREFPGAYAAVCAAFRRRDVARDDILDALAALWTARRIANGDACRIPAEPPNDRFGLPMEIVY